MLERLVFIQLQDRQAWALELDNYANEPFLHNLLALVALEGLAQVIQFGI
jgi:hypothetical protein